MKLFFTLINLGKINENCGIKFSLIFKKINFEHVYLKIELVDMCLLAKFLNSIFSETKRLAKKLRGLHFRIILVNQRKSN